MSNNVIMHRASHLSLPIRFGPREHEFLSFLEIEGTIDTPACTRVAAAAQASNEDIYTILLELGLITEARLADQQAKFLGVPRASKEDLVDIVALPEGVAEDFLRRADFVVAEVGEDNFVAATGKPLHDDSIRALGYYLGLTPKVIVGEISAIAACRNLLLKSIELQIAAPASGDMPEEDVERLRDVASDAPTVKLLNRLVSRAVELKASDIHIEPMSDSVQVRFRLDGALRPFETLNRSQLAGLISRIKILARLNIAEQRLPQDGRLRFPVRGKEIDFRVSTAPVMFGESVVLRILDQQEVPLDFAALGFSEAQRDTIKRMLSHPNGIILVTGPTGSGKTTTLYAALTALNRPGSKLFSVEDPIEYQLPGVNQIQVKPGIGLDFAAVLRSVLRQDPDIIMIGEMRDTETARIAVQASLTGHLVLATLHTNSAAASVTRLLDMGIESFLLGSTLRGIIAQRLVRRSCKSCSGTGCTQCSSTGFKGRTVVCEMIEVSADLAEQISRGAKESEIRITAAKSGFVPMLTDGRNKVANGTTTLEELHRVVSDRGS